MEVQKKRKAIGEEIKDMDKKAYEEKIDAEVRQVSNETKTKALGPLLGSIRKDMWRFAAPFYEDKLEADLAELIEKEEALKAKIAGEEVKKTEEVKEKDGKAEKKKAAAPPPKPKKKPGPDMKQMLIAVALQCVAAVVIWFVFTRIGK